MDLIALCMDNEISDGCAKEFTLTQFTPVVELFVVRKGERFYGYLNSCPHTGATLNWGPDQFLDFHNEYIQCCLHGALFQIGTGYCIRGPCAGLSLQAVEIIINSGLLYYRENPS